MRPGCGWMNQTTPKRPFIITNETAILFSY
jgi:hypothetical protein